MKIVSRKVLAVAVGLMLGWYAAGITSSFMSNAIAEESHGEHAVEEPVQVHDGHEEHAQATHEEGHEAAAEHGGQSEAGGHGGGADSHAAGELVPSAEQIAWYPKIIYSVIGLFVVAIIVGLMGKSKGVHEPGVLASEEDAEKAHGADDEDAHH